VLTETEAATRLGEGQPRTFVWFTPARRKPTEYELYTVGQQSGPQDWLDVDWPLRFDNGRAPWVDESSAVRSSLWPAYRDPRGVWQRPYVSACNQDEQALGRLLPVLTQGSAAGLSPTWSGEILAGPYAAWPFVEYGLFLALAYAVREARSDTIEFSVVFQAADHLRLLQDIVLHLDHLHDEVSGFSDAGAREAWMTDPTLVPIREVIERLVVSQDWMEILVAVNLVFEPLVGHLAKTELFGRRAPSFGDAATPTVLAQSVVDADRALESTQALVGLVCADPDHGPANRAIVAGWVDGWSERCAAAARAFLPTFTVCGIDADSRAEALSRSVARQRAAAAGAGVTGPTDETER
jgi:methane monooxygenase component A beta chain/propane monooxygenase small subunit